MRRWTIIVLGVVFALCVPILPGFAQDDPPQTPPLVVFIEDDQLSASSVMDPGPDGITRLEDIFKSLGATTRWLNLREPLPPDVRVVVLVRPLRTLSVSEIAHLWVHLARGNHLLLALDPNGLSSVRPDKTLATNTESARGGLSSLLWLFYGIGLQDTFLAESWFTKDSITNQQTTFTYTYPEDFVPHAVSAPLAEMGLPVMVWGARTLAVDGFGIGNYAVPLLYTTSGYGETNRKVFSSSEPDPLQLNLGADQMGHLMIGALAENTTSGSRVVVLGDSETVQNEYGLALDVNTGDPRFWGDYLLTQRLAAWLLDLPVEDWPGLPAGYTWVAVDGAEAGWPDSATVIDDPADDAPITQYDIEHVRAFRDDAYLYLQIQTAAAPKTNVRVKLDLENTFDGVPDVSVIVTPAQTLVQTGPAAGSVVSDGQMRVGDVIELRLPLRIMGTGALIQQVCLSDSRTGLSTAPIDCTEQPPAVIAVTRTTSPVDVWGSPVPLVSVYSAQTAAVNLRSDPSTDGAVIANPVNDTVFAAVGRNAAGDWVQVQNAYETGWLADFLVRSNINIMNLPVVGGAAEAAPAETVPADATPEETPPAP